jgi:hypothetical protein
MMLPLNLGGDHLQSGAAYALSSQPHHRSIFPPRQDRNGRLAPAPILMCQDPALKHWDFHDDS